MKIDTDAWFAVLAAARAHDRPDGPALERAAETGRLRIPALHSRAVPVTLPAPEGATGYAGVALLRLHDTEENAGNAFLDTLTVHPARRGRGVGRALWETVCGRLAAEGRTSVSTLVEQGGAGERFAVARGAEWRAAAGGLRTGRADGAPPGHRRPAARRLPLRRLERRRPGRPCRRPRPRP
ncbi:GNAT family N-acetyltransferase [Streptomyces sp. P9-2B-2]|uniref:GNAT family N-acetyltransferase n=1 Tax=Streptomyces TaxID=1883 RepID=UPI002250DDEF|nr:MULTISPECIES: GNAT family N-acetyltransferase [Streptomyces]MCX4636567.1 GNAT family N-acetyltransferase [Streptomyces platensis]WJY40349.1 GNAT family N-acetyltransferase [Streptomyces sp. P9-2B-2]